MNIFDAQKNWVSQSTMTLNNQDEDVTVLNITADGYIRISGSPNLIDWDAMQIIRGSYTVGTMPEYKAYVPYHIATCEDLFSIGDYTDVQSIIDGEVTRNTAALVLTGTEAWGAGSSGTGYRKMSLPLTNVGATGTDSAGLCTHYKCEYANTVGNFYFSSDGTLQMVVASTETLSSFKQGLATLYAAGTPVIVIYTLATATTESVTGQTLDVVAGDNTIEITQAGLTGLELEAEYQAAVSLTIQEVEDANLDNNVEVTIS
jgi:hypothetical protein